MTSTDRCGQPEACKTATGTATLLAYSLAVKCLGMGA
jgi:hypothetical protein